MKILKITDFAAPHSKIHAERRDAYSAAYIPHDAQPRSGNCMFRPRKVPERVI